MEDNIQNDNKLPWNTPQIIILNIKNTKGGVGPNTTEDETWEPGSL